MGLRILSDGRGGAIIAYSLRRAVHGDYDFLYALRVATMHDCITATWGWDDSVQEALVRERWTPSSLQVVVLGADAAGVLNVNRADAETFIALIEIHPRYQGRALARRSSDLSCERRRPEGRPPFSPC